VPDATVPDATVPDGLAVQDSGQRHRASGDHDDGPGDERHGSPEAVAMETCLRLLTAAPRTRAQLDQALRRRNVPQQTADAVLGRLARAGLINDTVFAKAWVESRHHARGLARRALTAELRQRGVDDDDVRDAIAELTPELTPEQEEAAARRLVTAKLASTRGRPLDARIRRLMGLLARKGYPPGMAYRVVREALEQEKADTGDTGMDIEAIIDAQAIPDDEPLTDEESMREVIDGP
jgi:regulatory protein